MRCDLRSLLLLAACLFVSGCLWEPLDFDHPLPAPFELGADAQAELNRVLELRDSKLAEIQTFSCRLTRWNYDPVFGPSNAPRWIDCGRFVFRHHGSCLLEFDGPWREKWVSTDAAVYQFDFQSQTLRAYPIPAGFMTSATKDQASFLSALAPLWADAATMKWRFYTRIVTPADAQGQVWLEVHPRTVQDAASFSTTTIILDAKTLLPVAFEIREPDRRRRTSFVLEDVAINAPSADDAVPESSETPPGWRRETVDLLPHLLVPSGGN